LIFENIQKPALSGLFLWVFDLNHGDVIESIYDE